MSKYKERIFSAYMTGLFSVADVILNCPINIIVNDLCIVDEIKNGLIKEDDPLNKMLKLAISYEKGQWENVMHYAKEIDIDASKMSEIYIEAVKWADNIY
jgi:EAL and modified HD-GYP domain-containing signal transduction protein